MYPVTGHTPPETKKCIRCGATHGDQFYQLCEICRGGDNAADLLIDGIKEVVSDDPDDMNPEGYETPYQIRASLGL